MTNDEDNEDEDDSEGAGTSELDPNALGCGRVALFRESGRYLWRGMFISSLAGPACNSADGGASPVSGKRPSTWCAGKVKMFWRGPERAGVEYFKMVWEREWDGMGWDGMA